MKQYIIDASAAVEYLLRTAPGRQVADLVADAQLFAPELLYVEIVSVLRRGVLKALLPERRAQLALKDLTAWPIARIAHAELIDLAWSYRHNISAYDAFYVAAAQRYDIPLLTTDGPLARAPGIDISVHNIHIGANG